MKSIIIHEFMIKELKLSGIKLLLYALIYSFTQFGEGCFVSEKVICKFLNISRSQFYIAKKFLYSSGLIFETANGCLVCVDYCEPSDFRDADLADLIRIAKTPWVK